MSNTKVHFSSATNEWATPPSLFKWISQLYTFTLDPCCTPETAKCAKFFTQKEDGLKQDWSKDIVFVNPPYAREIGKWIKKAYEESLKGATVVMLIPSRTETSYFLDYCSKAAQILFIGGRVHFIQGKKQAPAPFPSCFVVFKFNNHECFCRWVRLGLDIRRG